jgi:hypothetical protein
VGMGAGTLQILIALKKQGYVPNGSALIEIGAQQLDDTFIQATDDIAVIGHLFGVAGLLPPFYWAGPRDATNPLRGAPLSREFWTWLGLSHASIDIDGTPGSIPLDLNYDDVPADIVGKYAMVTNFGTTEHVANQIQSFKIIHDLAAPNALMLHVVPAGGMPDHGFISYNPRFFWMLCRSNDYKIVLMTMDKSEREAAFPENVLDSVSSYDPRARSRFADYRMPETALIVVLQKIRGAPFVVPIDIPTGTTTNDVMLRERYWAVLKPRGSSLIDRLWQWAYVHSPKWVITVKRKLFG